MSSRKRTLGLRFENTILLVVVVHFEIIFFGGRGGALVCLSLGFGLVSYHMYEGRGSGIGRQYCFKMRIRVVFGWGDMLHPKQITFIFGSFYSA